MKSSLALNANGRIDDYERSVKFVQENVLFVKGFLGPAVRSINGVGTLAATTARMRGILTDDRGRLRCPPGTAAANQFTDIQMSNCGTPGAAPLLPNVPRKQKATADRIGKIRNVLKEQGASDYAQVSSMVAAVSLDEPSAYGNPDLMSSRAARIGSGLMRTVGSGPMKAVMTSLVNDGKISEDHRRHFEAVSHEIVRGEVQSYASALSGWIGSAPSPRRVDRRSSAQ
jgi:hypothetical protein